MKVAFPNYQPDTVMTAELWSTALADMPGDTLKAALMACLIEPERAFAPSIGEIRGAALRLNAKAAGIPDAWTAYDEVRKMPATMLECHVLEEGGQNVIEYRELKFSHPLVARVAEIVGWPKMFPTDMPSADRSQFVKAYEVELGRAMEEGGRPRLIAEYIEKRRGALGGDALALTAKISRQLEVRK